MKEECDLLQAESSPELITITARRDVDNLFTTNLAHEKPPSCSSCRDEAVATYHAAIRVPIKQHTPFKVSTPRACRPRAAAGNRLSRFRRRPPSPDSRFAAARTPPDRRDSMLPTAVTRR
ncbi:hypothetical protein F2Q70_00042965 [Brassica cretica]|uniref:Uncharacterized protein n=1 Tax=Brassica cretica TaxID=69181 RepID=A0A8S9KET7_BRACR|nr:hypothetical protein F2Q70_00042965 [Brassica cretica]